MKTVERIIMSPYEPPKNALWIKPLPTGSNAFYVFDNGWERVGTETSEGTIILKEGTGIKIVHNDDKTYTISISDDLSNALTEFAEKLLNKQDLLEAGVNIKNINNDSILGKGSIDIPIYNIVNPLEADYLIPSAEDTKERVWEIHTGDQEYKITGDSMMVWKDNIAPVTQPNKIYIVSVIKNFGVWGEF